MRQDPIVVGRIVGAHGIRGEVKVAPRDGDPEPVARCKTLLLDGAPVEVSSARVHKGLALLKLPGVDSMDAALALRGKDLSVRREDSPLPQGEHFDDELLGLDVFDADSGVCLGELVKVEQYPAQKVYTVRGQQEFMIPAVKDVFIRSVDLEDGRMEVRLWEGMIPE